MSVKLGNQDLGLFVKGIKEEQQKTITITQNGTTTVKPDTGKVLNEVEIITSTPGPKEEQSKSVTITSNKLTTITPDEGKVLSEVNVTTVGIPREVSSSGLFRFPSTNFEFSLPSNANDIGEKALYYAFNRCERLISVDLSNITTITSDYAAYYSFYDSINLTNINLSNLTRVSGGSALTNAFVSAKEENLDLSKLVSVTSNNAMRDAFRSNSKLVSVDLSSLETLSGSNCFYETFNSCASLVNVDLSKLSSISASNCLYRLFSGCTSLKTLSFPSLTPTSFGSYTNQFNYMLSGVRDCTVHFPASIQSTIGSWSDVTSGFGGTNTTVLFDL